MDGLNTGAPIPIVILLSLTERSILAEVLFHGLTIDLDGLFQERVTAASGPALSQVFQD